MTVKNEGPQMATATLSAHVPNNRHSPCTPRAIGRLCSLLKSRENGTQVYFGRRHLRYANSTAMLSPLPHA